jgi:hypothetical protein
MHYSYLKIPTIAGNFKNGSGRHEPGRWRNGSWRTRTRAVVIFVANTVNLNNRKNIDWNDPTQIIILSIDGQEKVQLTEDNFFVRTWTVNRQTGTIVIAGHYDTNNNGKYDKTDKNEILIYDLKTLKLISKV